MKIQNPTFRNSTPFGGALHSKLEDVNASASAAILGIGSALGSPYREPQNGPFFIRTVSQEYTWAATRPSVIDIQRGTRSLTNVVDLGDLNIDGLSLNEVVDSAISAIGRLPAGVIPAILGGDHSITYPAVCAVATRMEQPIKVVQFDHHMDLQIWDNATALPSVQRESLFNTNVMSHVSDVIGTGNLMQVGVNPFATVEIESSNGFMDYLSTIGRQISVSSLTIADPQSFSSVIGSNQDIYVTVDVDVLSASEMSSTSYPATTGLSVPTLLQLIDLTLMNNRLVGFDVVEFAAEADDRSSKTLSDAQRAAMIFMHLLSWAERQSTGRHQPTCDDEGTPSNEAP